MPIGETDIKPGAVYVMDCYSYVQVLSVCSASVIFRMRRRNLVERAIRTEKTMSPAQFARHALAEVNGEFFPDFTDFRGYEFRRSEVETVTLRDHLARRAPHRPFATG